VYTYEGKKKVCVFEDVDVLDLFKGRMARLGLQIMHRSARKLKYEAWTRPGRASIDKPS
jgi:hypothetical protein